MSEGLNSCAAWASVHVFISSTFADMHAERDLLVKRVFPELREWCARRRLSLIDVDLRWGVTEEEARRNKDALKICLERIDTCRPLFLCFLGQRYGWIPGKDILSAAERSFPRLRSGQSRKLSITEYEIRHAMLAEFYDPTVTSGDQIQPVRNALFLERDPGYLPGLKEDSPTYLHRLYEDDASSQEGRNGLKAMTHLKAEVIGSQNLNRYTAVWDTNLATPELAIPMECTSSDPDALEDWRTLWMRSAGIELQGVSFDANSEKAATATSFNERLCRGRLAEFRCNGLPLAKFILARMKEIIALEYPNHREPALPTDLARDLEAQESFLLQAREGVVGTGDAKNILEDFRLGRSAKNPALALAGPPGTGKTTLLADWLYEIRSKDSSAVVIFRFIGADERCGTVNGLLRSLSEEFRERGLADTAPPDEPEDLRLKWLDRLAISAQKRPILLVLDGLDQLETGLEDLGWLPLDPVMGLRVLFSLRTTHSEAYRLLSSLRSSTGCTVWDLDPLSRADLRMMAERYLGRYLKKLDSGQLDQLLNSEGACGPGGPLFLKVALSELRVFGSFTQLQHELEAVKGSDPAAAFRRAIMRLANDPAYSKIPGRVTVPIIMGLLAHARFGLSASEMSYAMELLLPEPCSVEDRLDAVALILRQLRPYLAVNQGRFRLFYDSLRRAAGDSACEDASPWKAPVQVWHQRLSDLFDGPLSRETGRHVAELPFHAIAAKDEHRASRALCSLEFIEKKLCAGMATGLLEDYLSADQAGMHSEGMLAYSGFIRRRLPLLRKYPELLGQEALNEPPKSQLVREANRFVSTRPSAYILLHVNRSTTASPILHSFPASAEHTLCGSSDAEGRLLLTGTKEGRFLLVEGASGKVFFDRRFSGVRIDACCMSPDGEKVAGIFSGCEVRIYRTYPFTLLSSWALEAYSDSMVADQQFCTFAVSMGRQVRLWKDGTPGHLLDEHDGNVNACIFSRDGKRLITVCDDERVRSWDVNTGKIRWESGRHLDRVYSAVYSPSDRFLVTGSVDEIAVWDDAEPRFAGRHSRHSGPVRAVEVLEEEPQFLLVVSAGDDGIIQTGSVPVDSTSKEADTWIWPTGDGPQIHLRRGRNPGSFLVSNQDWVTHLISGQSSRDGSAGYDSTHVTSVAVLPDGRAIFGNLDGHVMTWNSLPAQGQALGQIHKDAVRVVMPLCYSGVPDTCVLVTAGGDNRVVISSLNGDILVEKKFDRTSFGTLAFRIENWGILACGCDDQGYIQFFGLSGTEQESYPRSIAIGGVAIVLLWTADGTLCALSNTALVIANPLQANASKRFELPARAAGMFETSLEDIPWVVLADGRVGKVSSSAGWEEKFRVSEGVTAVASEGQLCYSAHQDGRVEVTTLAGRREALFQCGQPLICISARAGRIVVGGERGLTCVLDSIATGLPVGKAKCE